MAEQVQYTSSVGSSGSDDSWIDDIWGIATDVIELFGLDLDDEDEKIEKARKQDYAIWREQQDAYYRQQRRENLAAQRAEQFAEDQFNWGKARWNKEYNLSKDQWLTQRKQLALDNRRTGLDRLMGGLMTNYDMQRATSNDILQRLAV